MLQQAVHLITGLTDDIFIHFANHDVTAIQHVIVYYHVAKKIALFYFCNNFAKSCSVVINFAVCIL